MCGKQILHCLIFYWLEKAKKNWKKSCQLAAISLYIWRFSWIREFLSYLKVKRRQKKSILMMFCIIHNIWVKTKLHKFFFGNRFHVVRYNWKITRFKHSLLSEKLTDFPKKFFRYLVFAKISKMIKNINWIHSFWRLLGNLGIPLFN